MARSTAAQIANRAPLRGTVASDSVSSRGVEDRDAFEGVFRGYRALDDSW